MIPAAIWIQRKIASWANRTSIINSFACGGARHLSSERPARQFPGARTPRGRPKRRDGSADGSHDASPPYVVNLACPSGGGMRPCPRPGRPVYGAHAARVEEWMPELTVGSEEHNSLFCRHFIDTHHRYEVRDIRWPDLDEADVQRLRAMPFWDEAVQSEATAAARVRAMADVEPDALLREAIAMQAYEEERHAALLQSLTQRYGITVGDGRPPAPRDAEWAFLRMGYGECFDSFFAFGLFRLSADTGLFPDALVRAFEPVIQEEARHIVFFVNWAAWCRANRPAWRRPLHRLRCLRALSVQAWRRLKGARGAASADDFTSRSARSF